MDATMEKYQFTLLERLTFTDSEAKSAAGWYQGPGWYYNPYDVAGNRLDARCAAKTEVENFHVGQLEALNHCGADGWSVAAFVSVAPGSMVGKLVQGMVGLTTSGSYFILQRRAGT
ncbi:MAG: hypothetical protein O3A37_02230 [Planctomycetota bacterium]|nr:hypothetical protein [Planctomycetota bacterium]